MVRAAKGVGIEIASGIAIAIATEAETSFEILLQEIVIEIAVVTAAATVVLSAVMIEDDLGAVDLGAVTEQIWVYVTQTQFRI